MLKVLLLGLAAAITLCTQVLAHEATLSPVMEQALADWPDHQVTMLRVSYPPGGYSDAHRHQGAHTFVYVLSGSLEMGVAGGEPVTLKAGDPFYEAPDDVHNVSRNASADEAADFLVFFVHPKGIPLVTPAPEHDSESAH